jgi:negative regulator of sigma E activity
MRDDYKEQLSALVDDELRPEESRFLVGRLVDDAGARCRISRYVLIRHALQRSLTLDASGNTERVATGVARALDEEPAYTGAESTSAWRRWGQPAAGLALAASVAVLTIGLWPGEQRPGMEPRATAEAPAVSARGDSQPRAVSDSVSAATAQASGQVSSGKQTLGPEMRQRLNSYMVNHSEHSATGGVGSVLTYVRIAGHDSDD